MASLAGQGVLLAVDGPELAPWDMLVAQLRRRLGGRDIEVDVFDARDGMASWADVLAATTSRELADDPDFEKLATISLDDLCAQPVEPEPRPGAVTVVLGPGAALSEHDELWYLDRPKRCAEAEVTAGVGRNLGQRDGDGLATTRRLFYVDWPVLDRHREAIALGVALWIDARDPDRPCALDASTLTATAQALVRRPFRTCPTFNSTPWGGHWGQRRLHASIDQPNTALGYELVAPESGVLIGDRPDQTVELPFQLLVSLYPREVLGEQVQDRFGTSFPIRFDYLDTVGGGNLSVHCHPRAAQMRDVFGWPYSQHETYYVMVAEPGSHIFLGLRNETHIDAFHADAARAHETGQAFDVSRHVRTHPAVEHQLYLVPAGTPHGSSAGNVVLEVSATPYLYSLRFYDWLRHDSEGRQRPVHVDLAFSNLDPERRDGNVAADLVRAPRPVRSGPGWLEEVLGELPEMFFDVRRLQMDPGSEVREDTDGRFHILNVVEGEGVSIVSGGGDEMTLAYAETAVVPAAVGAYTVSAWGASPARVVKAFVR